MVHHFLLTNPVLIITSAIKQLIHQAGFTLGLNGLHRQTAEQKNHRFIALWEITLQNAPESTWHWVTLKSHEPGGLFVGADFMLDLRR
jgi:hypothetical protein